MMQIILNHMQKVPKAMVYDWDIPTYLHILSYINLFKDGSNTILSTVDVVFFVSGITGIGKKNQKL